MMNCDILIIGGGPAGMAAALGAQAAGCQKLLLVEREDSLGGILNQCPHNGFGLAYFSEELNGPEYAERFIQRIHDANIQILTSTAVIALNPDSSALLSGASNGLIEVKAKAVILASGCRERPIGALPITGARPAGIFTAGAAQKMVTLGGYNIGSRFLILGSGDIGLIMARQLKLLGKTVLSVLEKEDRCGGLERNRINCLNTYGIPLLTRTTITRLHGKARLEGVTVMNLENGQESYVACDTLITSVGLIPERELAEQATRDGILPDWLFLTGNACFVHDLVDDVTIESEHVGREATRFIKEGNRSCGDLVHHNTTDITASTFGDITCIACPKSCRLTKTDTGYVGAVCGRRDPVLSLK